MKEETIESMVKRFQDYEDTPEMKRLTFDDLIRMDDDPVKYGEYAAYLLSRRMYYTPEPELREEDLPNNEIRTWLMDIVGNFLEERRSK